MSKAKPKKAFTPIQTLTMQIDDHPLLPALAFAIHAAGGEVRFKQGALDKYAAGTILVDLESDDDSDLEAMCRLTVVEAK